MEDLVQSIRQRVGRCLERLGLLEQDGEQAWLDLDPADDNVPWVRCFFSQERAGKDRQDTDISWILVGDTATSPSFQVQRLKF